MVKKAIQSLWKEKCTVIVFENEIDQDTGLTVSKEKILYEDLACHLRYYYYLHSATADSNSTAYQRVAVFVDKEVDIPVGSKVIVNKNDVIEEFMYAGLPVVYSYHKEVPLSVINRRA